MNKIKVGVLFGSRSVEHEVSIVTAMQIFANIDRNKYEVIPIYIDKKGSWRLGPDLDKLESFRNLELIQKNKFIEFKMPDQVDTFEISPVANRLLGPKPQKIDIMIPAIHGTYGEDGTLQGLLEMAGIPYTGCDVSSSALGMDKVAQKAIYEKEGIPVVKYLWFYDWEWEQYKENLITKVEKYLSYPVCVKPANLGSSIGVNIVNNRKDFIWAVSVAENFDKKVIIEEGLVGIDEINISVMGNNDLEASVCEQPVKNKGLLSYEEKYLRGGKTKGMASLSRLVPAPISPTLTKTIQDYAKRAFRALGCSGVSRIDFLVDIKKEKVYINEINTLPGSLSFYLWEKSGYTFTQLIDKLIKLGFEKFESKKSKLYSINSNILRGSSGTKA